MPKVVEVDADGDARTVEGDAMRIGDVSFQFHHTPHVQNTESGVSKPCTGVRAWNGDGVEFYYTSDTEFRSDIRERYPNAQAIFHDCTFSQPYEGTVHSHYAHLKTLPKAAKEAIVLMHYTKVPDAVNVTDDGFIGAAKRPETWCIDADGARPEGVGPLGPCVKTSTLEFVWVDP